MSRKGVSLPVNVLVILAIAIVVLLGIIAFFTGAFQGGGGGVKATNKFQSCCVQWRAAGCGAMPDECPGPDLPGASDKTAKAKGTPKTDDLETVAYLAGITNIEKACGCA